MEIRREKVHVIAVARGIWYGRNVCGGEASGRKSGWANVWEGFGCGALSGGYQG